MRHEPTLRLPATSLATLAPADLQTKLAHELQALLPPVHGDALVAQLIAAGFPDPIGAARRLASFDDPDAALTTLKEIVGRVPAGIMRFGAPGTELWLIESLLDLIGHAPGLARHLVVEPRLVGRLIDSSAYAPLPSPAQLDAEFAMLMEEGGRPRLVAAISGYRFTLGLQLLGGAGDALDIAAANCDLAEAGLRAMAGDVLSRMKETHGEVPGAELAILALGRFGGRSLTSTSDLDIIYLFTGDCHAQSDGRKPLDANEYFSRVAQQITTAMSTVTPLGQLYEVDTRLRPWGAKGMLACSTETYRRYHSENAWTWEHMALTRARTVYGSAAARREVDAIVNQRLRAPRDRTALLHDAVKMRSDIARHKPARGAFDVKLVDGGLVDLEFAVHVNQLAEHVGIGPRLGAAIRSQVSAGLIDSSVIDAHQMLSRMLIVLRLLSPNGHEPAPDQRWTIAQACGFADWEALAIAYAEARESVRRAWQRAIARPSEYPLS